MLVELLDLPQRKIFYIDQKSCPASFLIVDHKAGGILINTPEFSEKLASEIQQHSNIDYLFLPSKFGANKAIDSWKNISKLETIAHEAEVANIPFKIDLEVNHKTKLTRTMDFIPMGGRTAGSCALFLKNLPGVIFLGPILNQSDDGWPTLIKQEDDESFESRMFGVLGLKDLKYDYVFTDDFEPKNSRFGPGASVELGKRIDNFFEN